MLYNFLGSGINVPMCGKFNGNYNIKKTNFANEYHKNYEI